ncbi:hypothetical protein EMGBS3_14760 [Anaerolineaceae bacterium]|nr:hypothetical protein EMGBS3_14760 [Anaerolineaceae bacterium]
MNSEEYFAKPVFPHSSNTGWQMWCWDTLTGYQSEFNHSLAHPGPVFQEDGTINMVDIRVLFGAAGKGGYFKDHPWPLWPAGDREELLRFLNYKQIMPVPLHLQVINSLSAVLWAFYLALALFMGMKLARRRLLRT